MCIITRVVYPREKPVGWVGMGITQANLPHGWVPWVNTHTHGSFNGYRVLGIWVPRQIKGIQNVLIPMLKRVTAPTYTPWGMSISTLASPPRG